MSEHDYGIKTNYSGLMKKYIKWYTEYFLEPLGGGGGGWDVGLSYYRVFVKYLVFMNCALNVDLEFCH